MWKAVATLLYFISYPAGLRAETAVLILARGGSKGIPLKNLQTVGGVTLLGRAITTAKDAGLSDITVSTDHPIIALEAIKNGASIFRRSSVTATDWAPSIWGVSEFMANRQEIGTLVLIQVTSPFTSATRLRNALFKIENPTPYDCAFSTLRSYKLRWSEKEGRLFPINFNLLARPRRQDWNGELLETGAFYISKRHLIEAGYFQNNNCAVEEVSLLESLEVDSYYDLLIANTLHKNSQSFCTLMKLE